VSVGVGMTDARVFCMTFVACQGRSVTDFHESVNSVSTPAQPCLPQLWWIECKPNGSWAVRPGKETWDSNCHCGQSVVLRNRTQRL
jgi:hypothetical protein